VELVPSKAGISKLNNTLNMKNFWERKQRTSLLGTIKVSHIWYHTEWMWCRNWKKEEVADTTGL
jgi:hypothetical protein